MKIKKKIKGSYKEAKLYFKIVFKIKITNTSIVLSNSRPCIGEDIEDERRPEERSQKPHSPQMK